MTFPTAASTVYYNEDGEPLGWDTHYYDEPDVDDFYAQEDFEPDCYGDADECQALGYHGESADHTAEGWICATCGEPCRIGEDDEPAGMTDVEADADTLAGAGWGTDEDYGHFGDDY